MELSSAEMDRLASLTRLGLQEQEKERLPGQLGTILAYVQRLAEVDTQGVPETNLEREEFTGRADTSISPQKDVREQIIKNFPDSLAGALRVPAVFEKPKK